MTHARPGLDILAELRRGRHAAELTDAIAEVIAAAQDTGKPGEVVIKLKFDPKKVSDYETPQIEVTDSITTKRPRRSVMPSRFFLNQDLNLTRTDPNQESFQGIRDVSEPHTPIDRDRDDDRKAN